MTIKALPDARSDVQTGWRYTADAPADNWNQPEFHDGVYNTARGGFGTGDVPDSHIATDWSTSDIWIRKKFALPAAYTSVILSLYHDDDAEVYINDVLVDQVAAWSVIYEDYVIPDEFRTAFKAEGNILVIHCHNADGPGYIDAGISYTMAATPVPLVADARTAPTQWKYVTADPGSDCTSPPSRIRTGRGATPASVAGMHMRPPAPPPGPIRISGCAAASRPINSMRITC